MDSKSLDTSRRNSKSQSKRKSRRSSSRKTSKSSKRRGSSRRRPSRRLSRRSRSRKSSKSSRRSSRSSRCSKSSLNSDLSKKCSKSEKRLKKCAKSAKREARKEAFESKFDILERSDGFGAMIVYGFQLVHLVYCVSSIIFHSFFNQTSIDSKEWKTIIFMTGAETFSMILVLLVLFYRTPGFRCTVLLFQYLFVFACFSMFLKVLNEDQYSNSSFGLVYFSSTTLYGLSGFVHSLILMFALDFVGSAKMDDDFSEKYIVETKEKRKQKLYLMMAELLKSAVLTQPSSNVGVMVTDETGNPVKIDGSILKADVNRRVSLTLGNDSMKLASTSIVESTLSVPSEKVAPVQTVKIIKKNEPVYNHCTEQKDHFSPRVL